MQRENLTGIGGIFAALLATSCCIGPAVFILFGTTAGFLSSVSVLEPFRPYFIGFAVLMLGYSFWQLYLRKPDCHCEENRQVKTIGRVIFWIGVVMVIFALSFRPLIIWYAG